MLKVWNVSLIVATFSLALLGTFLVRSGILQSIHAFGDSTVGAPLLGLIAVVVVGSTALIVSRLDDLRSEQRIDSLASRESVFLVNNLLLVGLCRGDLLGHVLPADLRGVHRREGVARRRPGSTATRRRWRSCWCSSPGSGRCSPGGGSAPGRRGSWLLAPLAVGGRSRRSPLAALHRRRSRARWRWCCSRSPPSRSRRWSQEFCRGAAARQRALGGGSLPRRAGRGRRPQPAPLRRLHRPRRARRAADRRRRLLELPDQRATCACARARSRDGRRLHGHLRASRRSAIDPAEQRLTFGAVLDVDAATASRSRPCARRATTTRARRPATARWRLLRGRGDERGRAPDDAPAATSGPRCSPTWPARPGRSPAADQRLAATLPDDVGAERRRLRRSSGDASYSGLARARRSATSRRCYVADPPPVDFRVNVNPLVIWIWIGGAIAVAGGADRDLAGARGAPPPRLRRLRGAPGARAGPRLRLASRLLASLAFARWRSSSRSSSLAGARLVRDRAAAPRGRRRRRRRARTRALADLEARKEAKYREIRDAELDREQGKLSRRRLAAPRRRAARARRSRS